MCYIAIDTLENEQNIPGVACADPFPCPRLGNVKAMPPRDGSVPELPGLPIPRLSGSRH